MTLRPPTSKPMPAGRSGPNLAISPRRLTSLAHSRDQCGNERILRGKRRMTGIAPLKSEPTAAPVSGTILSLNNIEVVYDRVILVLKGVSLAVPSGGIVALLGANGAGKTTTLKAISNLLHSERGEVAKGAIEFDGAQVQALSPNEVVRRGCIQVMQGRFCFGHLTIEENLLTGAFTRRDGAAAIAGDLERIYQYFPKLKPRRAALAGYVSGGEQQMCALGRAMMAKPEMILL